ALAGLEFEAENFSAMDQDQIWHAGADADRFKNCSLDRAAPTTIRRMKPKTIRRGAPGEMPANGALQGLFGAAGHGNAYRWMGSSCRPDANCIATTLALSKGIHPALEGQSVRSACVR